MATNTDGWQLHKYPQWITTDERFTLTRHRDGIWAILALNQADGRAMEIAGVPHRPGLSLKQTVALCRQATGCSQSLRRCSVVYSIVDTPLSIGRFDGSLTWHIQISQSRRFETTWRQQWQLWQQLVFALANSYPTRIAALRDLSIQHSLIFDTSSIRQ